MNLIKTEIVNSCGERYWIRVEKVEDLYCELGIYLIGSADVRENHFDDIYSADGRMAIKWDGCSNNELTGECLTHFCCKDDIQAYADAQKLCMDVARELIPGADKSMFR